jgi:integrase
MKMTVIKAFSYWNVRHPKEVTPTQIRKFQHSLKGRNGRPMTGKSQSVRISYLKGYFEHCGVFTITGMKFRYLKDGGRYVVWLTDYQVSQIGQLDLSPKLALIVHMNRDLAMRRVDIANTNLDDIKVMPDGPVFDFTSKRRKQRIVPFHRDTQKYLDAWFMERDKLLSDHPNCEDPGSLIILYLRGSLKLPEESWWWIQYTKLGEQLGFQFTYHSLRRTWGRNAYNSKVNIKTIQNMLGHDDENETLKYIGINVQHMREALNQMDIVQDRKNQWEEYQKE